MERGKKVKQTLDSIFFVTPEQRLIRFLIGESTTSFSPRVLSSKLKGVRGLGGIEGIKKILEDLQEIGVVQAVDNNRKIQLHNDHVMIRVVKALCALCDLEGLIESLQAVSSKGVLFGSRATGLSRTDSDYNLFVVADDKEEVEKQVQHHPLGKRINPHIMTSSQYLSLAEKNPELATALERGFVLWGNTW